MNNSISLVGHVGQAPTLRTFPDTNNKLVKFSLAVKEFSPNTDVKKTMWVDVEAWNGLGERVLEQITKGREVALNGKLAINHFPKEIDGVTVPMTKPVIKLTSFHLCGPKPVREETTSTPTPPVRKRKLAAVNG